MAQLDLVLSEKKNKLRNCPHIDIPWIAGLPLTGPDPGAGAAADGGSGGGGYTRWKRAYAH